MSYAITTSLDGVIATDTIETAQQVIDAIATEGSIATGTVSVSTSVNTNRITISGDTISSLSNNDVVISPNGTGAVKIDNILTLKGNTISSLSNNDIVINPNGTGTVKTDNLQFDGNTISSTDTNGNIILAPNGTGTVKTDNLQFDSNTISSTDTNGNIILTPNGTGTVKTDNLQFDSNTISSTDTNGNIILTPNGTGNVVLGTMTLNSDQTVAASEDNYVLKYDHSSGTIGLEAEAGGSSNWTTTGSDIYRLSSVGIGVNASTIDSQLMVKDTTATNTTLQITGQAGQDTCLKLSRGNGDWSSTGHETINISVDDDTLLFSKNNLPGANTSGFAGDVFRIDIQNYKCGISTYPYAPSTSLTIGSVLSVRAKESVLITSKASGAEQSLETGIDATSAFIQTNNSANSPKELQIRQGTNSVVQSFDTNGNVGFTNNGSGTEAFTITSNTTRLMTLLNTGYVGIGTSSIRAPLEVISDDMGIILDSGNRRYFKSNVSTTGDSGTWAFNDVSIYGHGDIVSNGYFLSHSASTFSDRRIKDNIVDVQDDECLKKLRLIKPKRYTYKDKIRRGTTPVWGFIAQEVKETLNYAVSTMQKEIPNIYKLASVSNDGKTLIFAEPIVFEDEHKSVILKTHQNKNVEVLVVSHTSTSLTLQEPLEQEDISVENQVFVYGQIVSDFHHLNKDAIFTVAVSALQEIDRQQQLHKNKISTLEARMALLEQRLNNAGL